MQLQQHIYIAVYLASGHVLRLHYPPPQMQISWVAKARIIEQEKSETWDEETTLHTQSYKLLIPTLDLYSSMVTVWQTLCTWQPYLHLSVVKPMLTPLILGQDPLRWEYNDKTKVQVNHPNCFHVLCASTPSIYTCTPVAWLEALAQTRQANLRCFQSSSSDPSRCICSCNQPIGWDRAASDSEA